MHYIRINNECDLPDISQYNPFKCIVVIEDQVSECWQAEVSRWLVNSGCLYMMAWGNECSSWDTSVDLANIGEFEGEIPEEKFVTTWHEDEPLSEVFWFCKYTAFNEYQALKNAIVVHISKQNKEDEFSKEYEKA